MESEVAASFASLVKCCDCGCSCSLSIGSGGTWLRSVKRKYDEFERGDKFLVPGMDQSSVARVLVENECALLRETVSRQQQTVQDLIAELDEERNAASSAANEAMSMMLRLQREKAEIQMEARQFKRFAEEKTAHDQQEILALEDLLYKREQTIQSLTCEVQAYKYRMMSYGLTETEAEGEEEGEFGHNPSIWDSDVQYEIPTYGYPPLKCKVNSRVATDADNDDTGIEKYAFGETPCDRLRNLENRISEMERTPSYSQVDGDFTGKIIFEKVIVQHSPRRDHSSKHCCDSACELRMDSPKFNSFKKMDCVSENLSNLNKVDNVPEDDTSDRVYTIDSVHNEAPYNGFSESKAETGVYEGFASTPRDTLNHGEFEDPDIKKLYMRLQALEADRESMRQTMISMRTDKAQLVLLKEIAQHLCKNMTSQRRMTARKPSSTWSLFSMVKWVTSVLWRKRARSKHTFGLPADKVGLLMLLDMGPCVKPWRCLSSAQMRERVYYPNA